MTAEAAGAARRLRAPPFPSTLPTASSTSSASASSVPRSRAAAALLLSSVSASRAVSSSHLHPPSPSSVASSSSSSAPTMESRGRGMMVGDGSAIIPPPALPPGAPPHAQASHLPPGVVGFNPTASPSRPIDAHKERLKYRSSPIKRVAALFERRGPHAFARGTGGMDRSPRKGDEVPQREEEDALEVEDGIPHFPKAGHKPPARRRVGQHRVVRAADISSSFKAPPSVSSTSTAAPPGNGWRKTTQDQESPQQSVSSSTASTASAGSASSSSFAEARAIWRRRTSLRIRSRLSRHQTKAKTAAGASSSSYPAHRPAAALRSGALPVRTAARGRDEEERGAARADEYGEGGEEEYEEEEDMGLDGEAEEAREDIKPLPMPVESPRSSRTGRKELLLDQRRRHLQLLQARQGKDLSGPLLVAQANHPSAAHASATSASRRASGGGGKPRSSPTTFELLKRYKEQHKPQSKARRGSEPGTSPPGPPPSRAASAASAKVPPASGESTQLVLELKEELTRARKAIEIANERTIIIKAYRGCIDGFDDWRPVPAQTNMTEKKRVEELESRILELKQLNEKAAEERRAQAAELAELRSSMFDLRASVMDFRPSAMPGTAEMSLRYSHLDLPREAPSPPPIVAEEFLYTNKQRAKFNTEAGRDHPPQARVSEGEMFEPSNWSEKPSTIEEDSFHEEDDLDFSFLRMESARLRFHDGAHGEGGGDDDPSFRQQEQQQSIMIDENGVMTFEFGPGPIGITFHDKRYGGFVITGCEGVARQMGVKTGDVIMEINRQRLPEDMMDDELFDMLVELPRPVSIGFVRPPESSLADSRVSGVSGLSQVSGLGPGESTDFSAPTVEDGDADVDDGVDEFNDASRDDENNGYYDDDDEGLENEVDGIQGCVLGKGDGSVDGDEVKGDVSDFSGPYNIDDVVDASP